jgi:hypothetical protein
LTADEEGEVLHELSRSPAALEILSTLLEDAAAHRRGAPVGVGETGRVAKAPDDRRAASGAVRRARWTAWAVAASLFAAIGASFYGWDRAVKLAAVSEDAARLRRQADAADELREQLSAAERKTRETATSLLVAEKERLAQMTVDSQQPYLTYPMSPELLHLAMTSMGRPRGSKTLSSDEAAAVQRATQRLEAAAEQAASPPSASRLQTAAALVQAGRLDEAESELNQLGDVQLLPADLRAGANNVRGILLAARAQSLAPADAAPLWTEAERLFRQAAEAGRNEARLNLALMLVEEQKPDEARREAAKYVDNESDAELRAVVQRAFAD